MDDSWREALTRRRTALGRRSLAKVWMQQLAVVRERDLLKKLALAGWLAGGSATAAATTTCCCLLACDPVAPPFAALPAWA